HTKGFRAGACAIAAWPGSGDRLRDIACPTFLLFGDADFLMHPDVAYEMQRMIPHAELKMIHGGTTGCMISVRRNLQKRCWRFLEREIGFLKKSVAGNFSLCSYFREFSV
ncbi:MAG: hypothetical protein MJ014_09045, partial [Methanocorpusculum sp.]|nr:hypothetical protein [Methanocorpusculum sp.]